MSGLSPLLFPAHHDRPNLDLGHVEENKEKRMSGAGPCVLADAVPAEKDGRPNGPW